MKFTKDNISPEILEKARKIKLVITDCDGVLTDNGVYFTAEGEYMKRYCIRDGMGMERLRNLFGVDTAIMTGELSGSLVKRAEKLKIRQEHVFLGIKDKRAKLNEVLAGLEVQKDEIAFIGDDTNDVEVLGEVGLSACPGDATWFAKDIVDYICTAHGGNGAFRELAELIIFSKTSA